MPTHATLGQETVPPNEPADIATLVAIFRSIQEEKDRRQQPVPRNVHPKQHGCVFAELIIEPDLPPTLRHGLFAAPRSYASLVRFSNAKRRDDRLPDGHGLALKLLDVPGEKLLPAERDALTHDFILIDHPVFFAKNVADFISLAHDFRRLMTGGLIAKTRTVLKAMFSRDYRFRLIRRAGAKRPDSPLAIQYWSTTPYKLGEGAMKLTLRPSACPPIPPTKSADKLRLALAAHLRDAEARFDLCVQLQASAATMPIEDPTIAWDETAAPWQKVATLRIPSQTFDTPEQNAFAESLSFTPWHALPDHRPLGGINRVRRELYDAMARRRQELNGAPHREPTLAEVRALWPL